MKRIKLMTGVSVAVFLQICLAPIITIGQMIPNLVVVWLLAVYDRSHRMDLVYAALIAGILLDLNFSHNKGVHSLVLVLWIFFMTQRFFRDFPQQWFNRILVWGIACLAYHVIFAGVLYLTGYPVTWSLLFRHLLTWEILVNVVLTLVVYEWSNRYKSKSLKWFRM